MSRVWKTQLFKAFDDFLLIVKMQRNAALGGKSQTKHKGINHFGYRMPHVKLGV
ncbi:MAG: hypothetical protein IPM78_13885 [Moraxellaceae bacterium]|nr:hypothetical protein [Moraxellaceae bacterium]